MIRTVSSADAPLADSCLDQIQSRWSPEVRRQRETEGRRRARDFVRDFLASPAEPEIWAVGSLGQDDLQRLVG